jgi:nitroreductase
MPLKKLILRYAPPGLRKALRQLYFAVRLVPGHLYDYRRFLAYSGMNKSSVSQAERAARITLYYHQVEKGLSLAAPRANFGMAVIPGLLDDVDAYFGEYGVAAPATTAISALLGYLDHHERIGQQADYVRGRVQAVLACHHISMELARSWSGGVLPLSRAGLVAARNGGFKSFFESRHSVRQFAGGTIAPADLRAAVETAQKTPSVCNRQSWRVHAFAEPGQMARLLEIQSGSRGFGDQASAVLVVTSDLRSFLGVAERYQPWIDGGMFAMSLCLALHDLGYGSCCLNWSKEPDADRRLRAAAGLLPSEQIIMLVAVGTLPEEFRVARSYRPPVDQVLVMHGAAQPALYEEER